MNRHDRVVVMAGFNTSGLWAPDKEYIAGGGMIEPDSLGLTETIKKELYDWVFLYEDIWYNSCTGTAMSKIPKLNVWGKVIATKIHIFLNKFKYTTVWYCSQDEIYKKSKTEDKDRPIGYCVITRKSDDVTIGYSLVDKLEVIGVEQNHYYPVVGPPPDQGVKYIPIKSDIFPGFFE